MKYLTSILLTANLVLASCNDDDIEDSGVHFDDKAEVNQLIYDYFAALNGESIEACVAPFSANATFVKDDLPRVTGTSEITETYNFLFGSEEGKFMISILQH